MQSNVNNANGIITISDTCERLPRNTQVVVISAKKEITEIPNRYLKDCHQLKYIQMPEDIHTIGDYDFRDCKNHKTNYSTKRLYSIGEHCFYKCSKLKFIKLPGKYEMLTKQFICRLC